MSDDDALFRAVLKSPDDTTARLVYADWLLCRKDRGFTSPPLRGRGRRASRRVRG
ncbi:MAG TPA: TIGR02996 domain-containing protein [Gemmataceae bacterium]|nr:TIGR02996 domain-containing protein [Gemmataceae bacterium]